MPVGELLLTAPQWEVFLRQAGLNAYAAQVVLAELKAPDEHFNFSSASGSHCFGLPAFLLMSVEERICRFETSLGGRKGLLKVSALADAEWPHQASRSFSNFTSSSF